VAVYFTTTTNNTNIIYTPYTGAATNIITVMCWVYLPTGAGSNYRDIITADPNIYLQFPNSGNQIDFGTAASDNLGPILNLDTWYHVAEVVVPTSTTARRIWGYVNGVLYVNVADTTTFSTYTNVCIGNSIFSNYTYPLTGKIKDVRVWTQQLIATGIVDEMRSAAPVRKPGLLLWMPLDDANTTDESGNDRVITVGSAVTLQSGPMMAYTKRKRPF